MLKVTFAYICDHCGKGHETTLKIAPTNGVVPVPSHPDGWQKVNGEHVCDEHEVVVTDKQK